MKCCEVMEVAYQHPKIKSTRRNQTSQQPDDDNEIEMSDKNSNWSWNSSNSNSRWINLVPMPLATCWFSPQKKDKIKISQIFTPQPSSSRFRQKHSLTFLATFRLAPLQPRLVVPDQFTRSPPLSVARTNFNCKSSGIRHRSQGAFEPLSVT